MPSEPPHSESSTQPSPAPDARKLLQFVIDSLPLLVGYANNRLEFVFLNQALADLFGEPRENLVHRPIASLLDAEAFTIAEPFMRRALQGDRVAYENSLIDRNGDLRVFQVTLFPYHESGGGIEGFVIVLNNITEHKRMEEIRRANEERYRMLVENQGEGIAFVDENLVFEYANTAGESIIGAAPGTLIGRSFFDFVSPSQIPLLQRQLEFRRKGKSSSYELEIVALDGALRQILITATPRFDREGTYHGSFVIFRDITDRKNLEEKLRYQSTHDVLTGLYNRAFFEEEMARYEKSRQFPISFIMVDLDNLKEINDTYGHSAGDDLMRRFAGRLRESFRAEDIIARIGGDEFLILLPNTSNEVLQEVLTRLQKHLSAESYHVNDHPVDFGYSIGGATAASGKPLKDALDQADRNMYRNKRSRRQRGGNAEIT